MRVPFIIYLAYISLIFQFIILPVIVSWFMDMDEGVASSAIAENFRDDLLYNIPF